MQTATPSDSTALLISMNGQLAALNERTLNTQQDVQELKDAFEKHRAVTEKSRASINFLRGEWKVVVLAVGLVVEHLWNAARLTR